MTTFEWKFLPETPKNEEIVLWAIEHEGSTEQGLESPSWFEYRSGRYVEGLVYFTGLGCDPREFFCWARVPEPRKK